MKFYFDGDSFTYGGGLRSKCGIDPTQVRWSKLVSDHFGAEEINVSSRGAPNDRVLRHLFAENFDLVKDCDYIFIQLTYPCRGEFWSDKFNRWFRHTLIKDFKRDGRMKDYDKHFGSEYNDWLTYYQAELYSHKHGMSKELVAYNSIVSYLKLIGKPFLMSTLSNYTHIDYDVNFNKAKFDRIPNDGHPSVLGHEQIAEIFINKIKDNEVLL